MITEEEKQEIIEAAVERFLLHLPEAVGNLMTNQIALLRMNKEFYDKHPQYKNKDVVAAAIEHTEGKFPTADYDDILKKSIPEIERRLGLLKDLNMKDANLPNRDISSLFEKADHGDL